MNKWKIAIDRGGTFTDIVAIDPEGALKTVKILSESPNYQDASLEGIRQLLQLNPDEKIEYANIETIKLGTTLATNALLERKGGKVALIVTSGLRDILEIGYQNRPDIFKLNITKPGILYSEVFELEERINYAGDIITPLNHNELKTIINYIKTNNFNSVAIVLAHSWKNPHHELLCKKILQENNIQNVFVSHQSINLIKLVSRGHSTVIDAYLDCVIKKYIESISSSTGKIPIDFIESSGYLSHPLEFKGKDAILSGPAGGVIAVSKISEELHLKGAIGFDMGGTSTDVSRYGGTYEKVYEQIIDGIYLQKEALNINTVAAGGGSILWFDGQKLKVGPHSAGANPGPACYDFGGPLAITDANLLTGRIIPEYFPNTFGSDRNLPLNKSIVQEKFLALFKVINRHSENFKTIEDVALGFIKIANEKMALAIKEISVAKGFDVRDYSLICFGGAAGQHACQIASLLDINKIIFHPLSSLMSAYGIGMANSNYKSCGSVLKFYNEATHQEITQQFHWMENTLLEDKSLHTYKYIIKREIDLRPSGSEAFITVKFNDYKSTIKDFNCLYKQLYGLKVDNITLEVVNIKVNIEVDKAILNKNFNFSEEHNDKNIPETYQKVYYNSGWVQVPVYLRNKLNEDSIIQGPAIILDDYSTLIVDPEFSAKLNSDGIIILERININKSATNYDLSKLDPVLLEVFSNLFMNIANEMGHTLQNTAYSVNIKERLDFSCGIFDSSGNLVVSAMHLPVHFGSMSDTLKSIIKEKINEFKPGDVYISNNPYKGGSHLPDITLVCPIFSETKELIFFTAARAHHADIGGITPGSMPPFSSHINEEGILIDNMLLVRDGKFLEKEIKELLTNNPYPVRNLYERIHDFKAQIAACNKGAENLKQVISKYGIETVKKYMSFIRHNAAFSVKQALNSYIKENNSYQETFTDNLDDGTIIQAKIEINGGNNPPETITCKIDFTGTDSQHEKDNLNAPLAVTQSAILYVLRLLTNVDIPLNSGCLEPVEIYVPEGSILNPEYPVSVASGNVETSQRIVDVLLGAFQAAAASQGTMNNLLFQVEGESPYYETIAGGSGATKDHPGASAVQVHMTNTRITDPEILELRHKNVLLEQFKIRRGSGGKGKNPGGDGVIREIKFLKPAIVSILSERRKFNPYGINGGQPGMKGKNSHKRNNGEITPVNHRALLNLQANESIIIETPGGGGYGK